MISEHGQKSKFTDPENLISPPIILMLLALLILIGMIIGSGISFMLGKLMGYSLTEAMESLNADSSLSQRNFIRLALLANHLVLFVIPPLVLAFIFFKKKWYHFLEWHKLSFERFGVNIVLGALLLLTSMPLVQYLFYLNKKLPLPEWARAIEESTMGMIKHLVLTDSSIELFFNIFVIAVIPAIGEEMVFRGVIQKKLEQWFQNSHGAIWLAAAIFSGFHLQLEGFFPRLFLGAILGYLFYWSKSLWIPICIHFLHNALQILVMQLVMKDPVNMPDLEDMEQIPLWGVGISILLVLSIGKIILNYNQKSKLNPV